MKRTGPRIALVTNVLAHYRIPCFERLAERLPGQVTFFFLDEKMEHRDYVMGQGSLGLPAATLRGWKWRRFPHDDVHLNDIRPVLRGDYDVVILGAWDEPTYLLLWAWGCIRRRKILLWIESTVKDRPRRGMKEAYKRILIRHASGCLVPGTRAFDYCRQLGQRENRIFMAPNAGDREFFKGKAERLLPAREDLRDAEGLRGPVILFVGRLVEAFKGVSTLIKACGRLEKRGEEISLLIAGDGPEKRSYEELGRVEGLRNVRFLGTLDHDTLCRYYALSDIFVLPSRLEPWGFVLNEAMEFGLPLVISDAVGSGPDLVLEGENGFVVPAGDPSALVERLELLVRDDGLRRRMGQASRSKIENFSPERWARGVIEGIESAAYGWSQRSLSKVVV